MILITREEADLIREKFPNIGIPKTMKNHSKAKRGKRYVTATIDVLRYLSALRGCKVTDE